MSSPLKLSDLVERLPKFLQQDFTGFIHATEGEEFQEALEMFQTVKMNPLMQVMVAVQLTTIFLSQAALVKEEACKKKEDDIVELFNECFWRLIEILREQANYLEMLRAPEIKH